MFIYLIGAICTLLGFVYALAYRPPDPIEESHLFGILIMSMIWFISVPIIVVYMIGLHVKSNGLHLKSK